MASALILSGSTNGRPIPIAATSSPGTLIHTAHATDIDEVYLIVNNPTASIATMTLEWGGATDPGDLALKNVAIPANSFGMQITLGQRVTGSVEIRAFCDQAVNITGWANRLD